MNINKLYLFVIGSVRIRITGEYCERLLNILAANNITFHNLKKQNDGFEITIHKADFKKVRQLRKHTGVKVKILKKIGVTFIVSKYRFRYGIAVGITIFFLLLNFMSNRLWIIKINGNDTVKDIEIIETVKQLGVYEGILMKNIDVDNLKQKLVSSRNDIAWASMNRQGSVLEVNVTEIGKKKDNQQPCNLKSEYDAIIRKVDVQAGTVSVKIGDTVTKGQLLVSGIVDYGNGSEFTVSKGRIIGQSKSCVTEKIGFKNEIKTANGNNKKRRVLNVLGLQIPFFLGTIKGNYEIQHTNSEINLFGGKIPISITEYEFVGINVYYEDIDKEKAINIIKNKINERYETDDKQIVAFSDEKIISNAEGYVYSATIDFLTDIAVIDKINLEMQEK
ncbi:MAG: sporulation protein YqfD [Acutalibacteraceae bacterium]|nr:sporulation protein YqfD [Acutalibacteraceae bacterium]